MTINTRAIRFAFLILVSLTLALTASWTTKPATAGPATQAESHTAIPYQGRLTGDDGQPVADGRYDFTFTLYEAEGGGQPLWTERLDGVRVQDGYFGVLLGQTTPLGMNVAAGERYLAVAVRGPGDDGLVALEPRQRLVSPQASLLAPNCGATADHDHCGDAWTLCNNGLSIYGEDAGSSILFVENSSSTGGSKALWAYATGFSGQNYGLYGQTNSSTSGASGVYGLTHSGPTYGVYGQTMSSSDWARGVYGYAAASSGMTIGVQGRIDSTSEDARAVYGWASASSGKTRGVLGITSSSTDYAAGVRGEAQGSGGITYGVYGKSNGDEGRGVYGYASATSGARYGVAGAVEGSGYGLVSFDDLYVGGSCTGCTMVFIGLNSGTETLRVGDVVAASGVGAILQGHTSPVLEARRATSDDPAVLGVVYSRGEFHPAHGEPTEDWGDSVQPVEGDVAPGDYLLVVTSGLAQVRVGPVLTGLAPGEALTVADVAGRAALAGAEADPDLVFARAMEAQPDENGLLWAMISLP